MFDGTVLKITHGHDVEPAVMRQIQDLTPKLLYECIGIDGNDRYHCWLMERCIPLHQFAVLQSTCSKNRCVLAACRCMARAALCRLLLSDCHYYNFGVRITPSATEHEVVIIDVGSKGIAESVPSKGQVNQSMHKLWTWSQKELQGCPKTTRDLWHARETLEDVTKLLDAEWKSLPHLTATKMATTQIDRDIIVKCYRALHEFNRTPQGKLIELIGRSAVEWIGGTWNDLSLIHI